VLSGTSILLLNELSTILTRGKNSAGEREGAGPKRRGEKWAARGRRKRKKGWPLFLTTEIFDQEKKKKRQNQPTEGSSLKEGRARFAPRRGDPPLFASFWGGKNDSTKAESRRKSKGRNSRHLEARKKRRPAFTLKTQKRRKNSVTNRQGKAGGGNKKNKNSTGKKEKAQEGHTSLPICNFRGGRE